MNKYTIIALIIILVASSAMFFIGRASVRLEVTDRSNSRYTQSNFRCLTTRRIFFLSDTRTTDKGTFDYQTINIYYNLGEKGDISYQINCK